PAGAAVELLPPQRLQLLLQGHGRHRSDRSHRDRSGHVRDRLPAPGRDLPAYEGDGGAALRPSAPGARRQDRTGQRDPTLRALALSRGQGAFVPLVLSDFSLSPEQVEFRDTLRRFFEANAPMTETRRVMASGEGYSAELWKKAGAELGLAGLAIDERHGGQGFGLKELSI